jgi:heavy metal translocating P-type ATPase
MKPLRFLRSYPIPFATLLAIAAGAAAGFASGPVWRNIVWTAGLVVCALPVVVRTVAGMLRGKFAADVVATLAVVAAFALNEPFVGLIIVLMQSGGEALERMAEGRASEALRALQDAAPRVVHRFRNGLVEDVAAEVVDVGETILVRPGEVIPCDGEVESGRSHVDTSRITGEPVPIVATGGSAVMSGTVNQESPLVIRVTAVAAESQYARIVQLVREAQASKTPLQRVADRYAVWFTPLTIAVCGIAYAISGEWSRVLAVLAVATPCPLILATPVAVLGGMNRGARRQILFRNGGALEAIGTVTAVIFDKTGTITIGRPEVSRVIPHGDMSEDRLLGIAAGVEQLSGHLLARTIVDEAEQRGVPIPEATNVSEAPGRGVEGEVSGSRVAVGARSFLLEHHPLTEPEIDRLERNDGAALRAYVAIDGALGGIIEYADRIRPGMSDMIERLAASGVTKVLLLSGDREANAQHVAAAVGITDARGELLPEDKVETVRRLLDEGERVLMVGDGTNDAPALSAATVGVALASHGRGIATEAADVILLADEPARIVDGIGISRRTMRIARQSIIYGLGLSSVGMVAAAMGFIPPVAGALLQEGIDLAVIINALRASTGPSVQEFL